MSKHPAPAKADRLMAANVVAPLLGAFGITAGFAAVPLLTPLVVTLPYVLAGKIVAGAVARSLALELAAAWSPSKKLVVSLTTTEPELMELMLTATLLFG